MVENYKKNIEKIAVKTGFIRSTLEKVERLLDILEWINNHEKLGRLLALKGGTAINTVIFNFPRLSIKTRLLPTLKDRNPRKSNIDEMKRYVKEYLEDILIVDDKAKEFYDKFQNEIYEPELLFADEEIIERVKEHPMIIWKLEQKLK